MAALPVRDYEQDQDAEEGNTELATLNENWNKCHDLYSQVRNLPRAEMLNLLYVMLDELMQEQPRRRKRKTVDEAWGRLQSNGSAPTDEEVRQIVIDELMERHGWVAHLP
jgi:hypothetical protein